jgi:prepilin-type N-terminal cleavage/methylation domain-containing protein
MKMNNSSIIQDQIDGEQDDKGFTLIEILIAIVLVGILSAVAVVGISSLVSKGTSSACGATKDASLAASAVYFASNANTYPTTFTQLTTAVVGPPAIPAPLTAPTGAVVAASTITNGWVLTMVPGVGGAAPTFTGC